MNKLFSITNSNINKTMTFNEYSIVFKDIVNNIVENKNFICKKLYYDDDIYYSVNDIIKFLKCDDNKIRINNILDQIRDQDKFTLKQLKQKYPLNSKSYTGICCYDPNKELITNIGKEEDIHIFVNSKGFYYMIGNSYNLDTKPFIDFIYYDILPFLDKKYKEMTNNPEKNTKQILDDLKIIKDENIDIKTRINNIVDIEKNMKDRQLEISFQIKKVQDMIDLFDKKQEKILKIAEEINTIKAKSD